MADPRQSHAAPVDPPTVSCVLGESPFTSPFTSPTVDPTRCGSVLMVGQRHPVNLAHRRRTGLLDGITAVLAGCWPLLAPGCFVAVVSRPWRRDHLLHDLPGQIVRAA